MRNPVRKATVLFLLATLLCVAAAASAEEDPAHGWKESGTRWWGSLPETRAGFSDNGIALEATLRPGTGVMYHRSGRWTQDNAVVQLSTDAVNPGGNEYRVGETFFPVSATFVYGRESQELGWRGRVWLFFRELWYGFRPSGIRLTYAWGNRLPVGSMYRLWEEETVFILAGPEEVGKRISTARKLSEDFQAAYGRAPKGPITEVLVEASRPSAEKGPAHVAITVRYPVE
ncbi:MAG: DUF3047 domain-containing protein [Verrucomicrobiota bacterium]